MISMIQRASKYDKRRKMKISVPIFATIITRDWSNARSR